MESSSIVLAILAVILFAVAYRSGDGKHVRGMKLGFEHMIVNMPRVFFALIAAGFLGELLPKDIIASWLGHESGIKGIAIATAVGAVMPGGPLMAFPIVVALAKAGAGLPALVTFLTAWSVLGVQRIFAYELTMLGPKFVINRLAVCFFVPPMAGFFAYLLTLVF